MRLFQKNVDVKSTIASELQQVKLRVLLNFIFFTIFLISFVVGYHDFKIAHNFLFLAGTSLFGTFSGIVTMHHLQTRKNPTLSVTRILYGQFMDAAASALVIYFAQDYSLYFIFLFLWTTLGNAMRFGVRLMVTMQFFCVGLFLIATHYSAYWQEHMKLVVGLTAMLLIIPAYYAVLINRLQKTTDSLIDKEKTQVQLLRQMDNFKTEFFANISHEFRTPIALTLGSLDLIEQGKVAEDKAHQYQVMRRNQNRLLHLINQILDLEKMESGKMELKFRALDDIDGFFKRRVDQFQPMADKKGVKLEMNIATHAGPQTLFVDPDNLDKVIFNLLSNAFKFTNKGSVRVDVKLTVTNLELSVADSGIGIKEEQIPFIFERFKQAAGSESKDYAGTGIGLSLVQEIVRLHGGELKVSSVYGEGTVFTAQFPLGKGHIPVNRLDLNPYSDEGSKEKFELVAEGVTDTKGIEEHARWNSEVLGAKFDDSKKVILYTDDNYDLREFIRNLIGKQYNLLLAWDGIAALEIMKTKSPDLILSDLMMPNLDGAGFLKKIKENSDWDEIPFVILTAKAMDSTKIDLLEAGADDFLFKPFTRDELMVRLKNLLNLREKTQLIKKDLLAAKQIQRSLLPERQISYPKAEISVLYRPCETLSGDFFDILQKESFLLAYVADVTSHGTSAAQITYLVKGIMKNLFDEIGVTATAKEILVKFAEKFVEYKLEYGVGIQIMKYDLKNSNLTYTSSNAPTAYIYCQNEYKPLIIERNTPIDARFFHGQKSGFTEISIKLEPGSSLFCFTDGCFEFQREQGGPFSEVQFLKELRTVQDGQDWREKLFERLAKIQGKSQFTDDMTVFRMDKIAS